MSEEDFPFDVTVEGSRGRHKSGTKEYTLARISDGKISVLLRQWGKIGAVGQFKIETGAAASEGAYQKILRDRISSGYDMRSLAGGAQTVPAYNLDQFFNSRQAQQIRLEFQRAQVVKELQSQQDDLNRQRKQEEADRKRREELEVESQLLANPLYGMF